MDKIIKSYPHIPFEELNYCYQNGIMYQRDMNAPIDYDKEYFERYVRLENTEIAKKLNVGRTGITEKYCDKLLDIGVGSGEFIKESNIRVYGYDINKVAIKWLKQEGLYRNPYSEMPDVGGVTLWDSMEHIADPGDLLSRFRSGMYAFITMPIFTDLTRVKRSKHYRPNEHFYYFTVNGMIKYMTDSGFQIVEISDHGSGAGREDILGFVFLKC